MYPYFETLLAQDGSVRHFEYHRQRMERTLRANGLTVPHSDWFVRLEQELAGLAKERESPSRLHVDYDGSTWSVQTGSAPSRPIRTLRLVEDNRISYPYKSTDRSQLDRLFALRGEADDVLIVKEGHLTDTSIANLLLLRHGEWFTPRQLLLLGTTQVRLVDELHLQFVPIAPRELECYEQLWIINALRRNQIVRVV